MPVKIFQLANCARAATPTMPRWLFPSASANAATAKLNSPYGVAWDALSGTIYVADTLNNRIRAIAPDGTMSTLIGPGVVELEPAVLGMAPHFAAKAKSVVIRHASLNRAGKLAELRGRRQ